MIILPLVGFHFMKILGAKHESSKLTFVYYAHIGIMGLAEAMRIDLEYHSGFSDQSLVQIKFRI